MSINISHLTQRYGSQKALDDVNLTIDSQHIIGLLGPNGAGKSTLMNSITGVRAIDEGSIEIFGKDIQKHPLEIKKRVGYLPENNPLYLDMYVKEYLYFVCNLYHLSHDLVPEIIEKVGLTPEQHKKIKQLSKGYKQRVGLAQALLPNPDILILDEPTNGLDPNQIIEIRQLIIDLAKDKTVLFSTHIMQEVEAICDTVVLINQGKIIKHTSKEDFLSTYSSMEEAFSSYTKIN